MLSDIRKTRWHAPRVRATVIFAVVATCAVAEARAQTTIPSGTALEIRLTQSLSSYTSKPGTPVTALLIAPVERDGQVLLPQGTELSGFLRDARRVGLGFSRETAMLDIAFDRIQVPGQAERSLAGQVSQLDNARESVDSQGRIRGIRATDSFATVISGLAVSAAAFDPMSLAFALSSSLSTFRIPDSSIVLPAGTELHFRLTADLTVDAPSPPAYPALPPHSTEELDRMLAKLPFRTATETGAPSDLTSLMYVGSLEAIERAFLAAGWVRADKLDGRSTYGVMKSIVENQGYRAAPMSLLLLDGRKPEIELAKTLNTFFSRHHLRIYAEAATWLGRPVATSTATYDSGIGFSRAAKTFIHVINENIDEERTKVVNDLMLTGCVTGVGYRERPWVPLDAKNSTGDQLRTDGRIAILTFNDCTNPERADKEVDTKRLQMSRALRPVRSTVLTLRNDLLRGNLIFQGYSGIHQALALMRKNPPPGEAKSFRYGGQEFQIVSGAARIKSQELPADAGHKVHRHMPRSRSYAGLLNFSISAGLSGFGNSRFATLPLAFNIATAGGVIRDPLDLSNEFVRGWTIAPRVTLNSWRYVSTEFSYSRTTTNFRMFGREALAGENVDLRSKAAIRRYAYNALFHLRPRGSRLRPFVAAGPAFQLIHLLEAKPEKAGLLRFAARDIALFKSAYDFGKKPPLEGGGIFQAAFDYGGGVIAHLTSKVFLRADYRETLSPQPDFWKSSTEKLRQGVATPEIQLETGRLIKHGPLRHQTVTMGIGVSF